MEITLERKDEVWRGRGHPQRVIPDAVKKLADGTYRTGKVGTVSIGPDDEADIIELKRMLISYAKGLGRRMRIQHDTDQFRFEMVDKVSR